jgi:hypothetical protein
MEKMHWENLKEGMCPQHLCGGKLVAKGIIDSMFRCDRCPFMITEKRFSEIIMMKQKRKRTPTSEENLAKLSNWGRKRVSEDYSDEIENME